MFLTVISVTVCSRDLFSVSAYDGNSLS